MTLAARIRALEREAASTPRCACPPHNGVEVVIAEKGREPKPGPPCPVCGFYRTLVVITEYEPPPLKDVRRRNA